MNLFTTEVESFIELHRNSSCFQALENEAQPAELRPFEHFQAQLIQAVYSRLVGEAFCEIQLPENYAQQ